MDDSEDNMSAGDTSTVSNSSVKVKPKKRSLVERELETSLTARVTSPITNGSGTNTSRYGRARRLKTNTEFCDTDKAVMKVLKSPQFEKTPVKSPTAYKMHASNSPVKLESPRNSTFDNNLENQIENIYNANISLSRFGSEEKAKSQSPAKKYSKVYMRKDLIQTKEKEETITLIKNMFSPARSAQKVNSHLNNVLERSSEKYMNGTVTKNQNGYLATPSVVKTLDFDGTKKKKKEVKDVKPLVKESKGSKTLSLTENKNVLSKSDLFDIEAKSPYQVGDLAWARMGTFPFWPCIVTREPSPRDLFIKKKMFGKSERDMIHVTFLGDNGRRSWILDSMLKPFQGLAEFEATRDKFTPETKKKDPRLHAAYFVSDKKLALWYTSIEEAETLQREPKRFRIDVLNDILTRPWVKVTPKSKQKITRTNSDVSLSESLYDSLFLEGDGKSDDMNRSRNKPKNKSLDVSEVVTACLDNMAAKTGLTNIQKQSHMDRWLQKAKSKTPEKLQYITTIPLENSDVEIVEDSNKKDNTSLKDTSGSKKKKRTLPREIPRSQKPYSLRRSAAESQNLLHNQNEHDYSICFIDKVESLQNKESANNVKNDIIDTSICIIDKVESLQNKETESNDTNKNDTVDKPIESQDYIITNSEPVAVQTDMIDEVESLQNRETESNDTNKNDTVNKPIESQDYIVTNSEPIVEQTDIIDEVESFQNKGTETNNTNIKDTVNKPIESQDYIITNSEPAAEQTDIIDEVESFQSKETESNDTNKNDTVNKPIESQDYIVSNSEPVAELTDIIDEVESFQSKGTVSNDTNKNDTVNKPIESQDYIITNSEPVAEQTDIIDEVESFQSKRTESNDTNKNDTVNKPIESQDYIITNSEPVAKQTNIIVEVESFQKKETDSDDTNKNDTVNKPIESQDYSLSSSETVPAQTDIIDEVEGLYNKKTESNDTNRNITVDKPIESRDNIITNSEPVAEQTDITDQDESLQEKETVGNNTNKNDKVDKQIESQDFIITIIETAPEQTDNSEEEEIESPPIDSPVGFQEHDEEDDEEEIESPPIDSPVGPAHHDFEVEKPDGLPVDAQKDENMDISTDDDVFLNSTENTPAGDSVRNANKSVNDKIKDSYNDAHTNKDILALLDQDLLNYENSETKVNDKHVESDITENNMSVDEDVVHHKNDSLDQNLNLDEINHKSNGLSQIINSVDVPKTPIMEKGMAVVDQIDVLLKDDIPINRRKDRSCKLKNKSNDQQLKHDKVNQNLNNVIKIVEPIIIPIEYSPYDSPASTDDDQPLSSLVKKDITDTAKTDAQSYLADTITENKTDNSKKQADVDMISVISVSSGTSKTSDKITKKVEIPSKVTPKRVSKRLSLKSLRRKTSVIDLDSDIESVSSLDDITLSDLKVITEGEKTTVISLSTTENTQDTVLSINKSERKLCLVLTDCILQPKESNLPEFKVINLPEIKDKLYNLKKIEDKQSDTQGLQCQEKASTETEVIEGKVLENTDGVIKTSENKDSSLSEIKEKEGNLPEISSKENKLPELKDAENKLTEIEHKDNKLSEIKDIESKLPEVKEVSSNSGEEIEIATATVAAESPKVKKRKSRLRKSDSLPQRKVNGDREINGCNKKDTEPEIKIKEVELDTISIASTDSAGSTKRRGKKSEPLNMNDPEFLKYLELRQDALIDEHPELTQDEIVAYLFKTWQYEESFKSEQKKNDDIEQSNLVKGVNQEPPKKKRTVKSKKVINIFKIMCKDAKIKDEAAVEDVKPRELPKRKSNQPLYKEDFSDIEDEIELFAIFKPKKKTPIFDKTSAVEKTSDNEKTSVTENTPVIKAEIKEEINDVNGIVKKELPATSVEPTVAPKTEQVDSKEIIELPEDDFDYYDEEEMYFEQLTKPKPNIFRGLVREKVCEICEKTSNLVKCKQCNGMFHVDCTTKETEVIEVPAPIRGRKKKKKPRGRKPKNSLESNEDSHSDEKSHDPNVSEENMSIEELPEPIVIDDADDFEEKLAVKMKEIIETIEIIDYDSYDSDDCINWKDAVAGQCEIVDVKLKPRPQPVVTDYSDFKCKSCQENDIPICFVCKSTVSPKTKMEKRQKCQVPHCHKFFHLECLEHWPQTQFASGEPSRNNKKIDEHFEAIMCPRHVCHTCVCDDPRGCKTRFSGDKLARCVRCPATYHSFNKCLPAGTQILSASHIVCPRHYQHRPGKVPCHVNTGWCFICALGGTLICCEYCPTSFHADCLNIEPPEGGYMCEDCETGRLPLYGEMVWVKLGHYRWWPGIILHPSEIPDNIMAVKHSLGEFVVRFFGQYDHYWVNRGRVFPFQEGDSGRLSGQKSKIDEAFTIAMEHAQKAFEILKNVEPNDEENQDIQSSLLPPHYVKLKVNKPCGSLYGRKIDIEESSLTQCECNPDEEEPCGPYSHCLNRMLLTECGPTCRAGERCQNRAFERRQYPKMVPYRTPHRGWGLRTLEDVKAGQFVIEYVGELIDEAEFQRRMRRKHEMRDENYYFLTLDKERMIDAGPKGNLARFMNHCCEPNCETQKWTVLGDIRVGLFAINDIPANTEVTFNYNLECAGIEKKQCMCGAKRCSGYIGAKPKQDDSQLKKPKRTYKKRKNTTDSPSTPKTKPKRPVGRPAKPRELTEIEKDLLIIKNATNGLSSDSEGSGRLSSVDNININERKDEQALKRKRESISTEEIVCNGVSSPSVKRIKLDDDKSSEVGD